MDNLNKDAKIEYQLMQLKLILDSLTDEQRHEIISNYCHYCGSKDKQCYCDPKYDI